MAKNIAYHLPVCNKVSRRTKAPRRRLTMPRPARQWNLYFGLHYMIYGLV